MDRTSASFLQPCPVVAALLTIGPSSCHSTRPGISSAADVCSKRCRLCGCRLISARATTLCAFLRASSGIFFGDAQTGRGSRDNESYGPRNTSLRHSKPNPHCTRDYRRRCVNSLSCRSFPVCTIPAHTLRDEHAPIVENLNASFLSAPSTSSQNDHEASG